MAIYWISVDPRDLKQICAPSLHAVFTRATPAAAQKAAAAHAQLQAGMCALRGEQRANAEQRAKAQAKTRGLSGVHAGVHRACTGSRPCTGRVQLFYVRNLAMCLRPPCVRTRRAYTHASPCERAVCCMLLCAWRSAEAGPQRAQLALVQQSVP